MNLNKIVLISTSVRPIINWSYYSSLTKIVIHLAWIHWKRGEEDREDFTRLSVAELQSSKRTLVKLLQMESYPFEYSALYSGQEIGKSSKLLSLSPFMNNERVLCVGGHLKLANIPCTSKNQMIVSKSHYLAHLIITDIHHCNLHTGREQTLSLICNVYWIPLCSGLIRTVLRECLYCK